MVTKSVTPYAEILDQIKKSNVPTYFKYQCEFEVDGLVIPTLKVIAIDENHNYITGSCGEITITVGMHLDAYEQKLYPNRTRLRAVIKKSYLNGELEIKGINNIAYYAVVPLENSDRQASSSINYDPSMGIGQFTFQLIPAPIEKLRLETVGGAFVDSTALDVLMVLLGGRTKARATSSDNAFLGFSKVDPPKEMRPKPQIIIDHLTPLLELPSYLQKRCGGIYNHSIGCYFHAQRWYTFPIYDTSRYDRTKRILDIAILPPKQSLGIDKTYDYANKRAFVLGTAEFKETDVRDLQHLVKGNGVRFTNASQVWESFAPTAGNKSSTDLRANVSQFVVTERSGGDQSVPFSDAKITDNVCEELSKINARNGSIVEMMWKYANPDILYPGMPVKIHFPVEQGTKERLGVLVGALVYISSIEDEMTASRMGIEIALRIFLAD